MTFGLLGPLLFFNTPMQARAAEERSKKFSQGGGGEKLKAKAMALEEAEKKNKELGGPNSLRWTAH